MASLTDEKLLIGVATLFFIFSSVVIDPTLGAIFAGMVAAYAYALRNYGAVQWQGGRSDINTLVMYTLIGIVFFIVVGGSILQNAQTFSFNYMSVFETWSSYMTLRLFTDEVWVRFMIWGVMIPIAETMLLGFIIALLRYKWFRNRGIASFDSIMVILICGAIFSLLHVVSHVMAAEALIMDFIFFAFSAALVMHRGQLSEAGLLHIAVNSISVLI